MCLKSQMHSQQLGLASPSLENVVAAPDLLQITAVGRGELGGGPSPDWVKPPLQEGCQGVEWEQIAFVMCWDLVSTSSLVRVFSIAPQCNLWFIPWFIPSAVLKSGQACFLILQNLKVVFVDRVVYFPTTYTPLTRTSQQGHEALHEGFLMIVFHCSSFEISNQRHFPVRGSIFFFCKVLSYCTLANSPR